MPRPRINARKLFLLLLGIAVLAGGLYVGHRLQVRRQVQSMRQRIDESLAAGDDEAAIDVLERYLAIRPADNGRLAQLSRLLAARVFSGTADGRQTAVCRDVLRAAVARMPQDAGLRESWAQFLFGSRDFAAALPHLRYLWEERAADVADPKQRDMLGLMVAQTAAATGDLPLAQETLETLVGRDAAAGAPAPREAYVGLFEILVNARKEPKAADEILERMVADRPDDAVAWRMRGEWLLRVGRVEDATAAIERARRLDPADPVAALLEVVLAIALGDLDRAEAILAEKTLADAPPSERQVVVRADVALARRDIDAAVGILRRGVDAFPESREILHQALLVAGDAGRLDDVRALLTAGGERLGAGDPAVQYGEALVAMNEGRWEAALQSWEGARETLAANPALAKRIDLAMAHCLAAIGRPEDAADARRRAVSDDPLSIEAILLEAQSLSQTGRQAEALTLVERVATTIPAADLPARPAVWQPLLRLRVADVVRRPEEERDWSKVDAILESIDHAEAVPDVAREAARILVLGAKGRVEEVVASAEAAVAARPDDASAAARLLSAMARAERGKEALARVESWPAAVRDSVEVLAEEADIAANVPGVDAEAWLSEVERGLASLDESKAIAVKRRVAAADARLGKIAAAERVGEEILAALPSDLPTRQLLLDLAIERADGAAVEAQAVEIERLIGGGSPVTKVARAASTVLETADGMRQGASGVEDMDAACARADRLLAEAEEERPGWPDVERVRAMVSEFRGDRSAAIGHLRRAVKAGEVVPWSLRRLARVLVESGRFDEAMSVIASLGASGGPVVDRLRADLAEGDGRVDDALAIADKATPPDCRDFEQVLWHARLLARHRMTDEAVAAARRAIDLAPGRAEPRLTLLKIEVDSGRGEEAASTEAGAIASLPLKQREVFELEAAGVKGDVLAVERVLRDAVKSNPGDPVAASRLSGFLGRRGQADQARAVLEELMSREGAASTPAGREARRRLAVLLGSSGRQADLQEALRLLTTGESDDGAAASEDAAVAAAILAGRSDPASWRRAIAQLDALETRQPLSTDQRLLRARTRGRLGGRQRALARDELAAIADSPEAGLPVFAMLVEMAIDDGDSAGVERWLDGLRRRAPGAPGTALLEIRAAVAAGDDKAAGRAIDRILPTEPLSERSAPSLMAMAAIVEDAGFPERAERVFREAASLSDAGRLRWARHLGHRRRTSEAIDEIEVLGARLPAVALLQTLVEIVAAADEAGLEEVQDRVDAFREKILRENPGASAVALQAAVLADVSGRDADAVSAYRKLISGGTLTPRQHGIAAGNLAFDLAAPETAEEAATLVEHAIGELGPIPDLLDTRALIRLARGDTTSALEDMADAILVPKAGRFLHLATLYVAAGDLPAARNAFEKAITLGLDKERLSRADQDRRTLVEAALAGGA